MKIKYNIQKIAKIREMILNLKLKINSNRKLKKQLPVKHYALLVSMLMVGVLTLSLNLKRYNNINSEDYVKYELDNMVESESDNVEIVEYETAVSSISTNVASEEQKIENKQENKEKYIFPVSGTVIKEHTVKTLAYSKTLDMWRIHPGIDIKADIESNVYAVYDGKVVSLEHDTFYGNTVKIEHDNGYISVYSNLGEKINVKEGDSVNKGETIGVIGVSAYGEIKDDSHLHFEILQNGEHIDPLEILE